MSWANEEYIEVRTAPGLEGQKATFSRKPVPAGTVLGFFTGRHLVFPIAEDGSVDYGEYRDPQKMKLLVDICVVGRQLFCLYPCDDADDSPIAYMNHHCDANCEMGEAYVIRARRDIPAGEELHFDYRKIIIFPGGVQCRCQENCQTYI